MVSLRNYLLCVCMILPANVFAQAQLIMQVDKTRIEQGDSIEVKLYGLDLRQSLDDISLESLNKDFGVVTEYNTEIVDDDARWPDKDVQLLRFKIYPRSIGELSLPSIKLGKVHSQAINLHVSPGSINNRPIIVNTSITTTRPWQRQQVLISVAIQTPELFASLESSPLKHSGTVTSEFIPATRTKIVSNGNSLSNLHVGWVFYPMRSGRQYIDLPPIQYHDSGRISRVYYLPPIDFDVRALPPYIPPTMPVGEVRIDTALKAENISLPDTLNYWTVTLSSDAIPSYGFPAILRQIASNTDTQFYPASTSRTSTPGLSGIQSRVEHQIPFKAQQTGRLKLPELTIQYFDPQTGRLQKLSYSPQSRWVISYTWRSILLLTVLIVLGLLTWYLYQQAARYYRFQKQRSRAIHYLRHAHDVFSFRAGLKIFAAAHGWPENISLSDWGKYWCNTYKSNQKINDLLFDFSCALYAENTTRDSARICAELFSNINHARRYS